MMERTVRNIIAVLLVMISSQAVAEYKSYGAGTSTCGKWVESRRDGDYFIMAQWMLGFVSAAGYFGHKPRFTESSAMVVWMDNYCQQNPLRDFSDGVIALVEELQRKR